MGLNANIMVQEFVQEAAGSDIRCFVIGDKVVAAMKRQGREGEFRSNLHRGGTATLIRLAPAERAAAVQAAKIMGLDVCGVDLLRSKRGPLVMEVNSSPGLEGIEKTSGKDIAGLMIEHIEKTPERSSLHKKESGCAGLGECRYCSSVTKASFEMPACCTVAMTSATLP